MSFSTVKKPLFQKENYGTWKIYMKALLIKNDAWGYVHGTITKPEENKSGKFEEYLKSQALSNAPENIAAEKPLQEENPRNVYQNEVSQ